MEVRYVMLPKINKEETEMLWADEEHGCYYRNRKTPEDEWKEWYEIPINTYNILRGNSVWFGVNAKDFEK